MSSAPTEIAYAIVSLDLISKRARDGQINREEIDESQMQLLCNWKGTSKSNSCKCCSVDKHCKLHRMQTQSY
jgi:hypothetical protein